MIRSTTRAAVLVAALAMAMALPAGAAEVIDAEYGLSVGESVVHTGEAAPGGLNPLYFDQGGVGGDESCSKAVDTYCETILITLDNPVADTDPDSVQTANRTLSATLNTMAGDYDLFLYKSDAEGNKGAELARSTEFPTGGFTEFVSGSIRTTEDNPTAYALIQVVYFVPTTSMTLDVRF